MFPSLDLPTVLAVSGCTGMVPLVYLIGTRPQERPRDGTADCIAAAACLIAYSILICFQGRAPEAVSIVLANSLGILGNTLICRGLARLFGKPFPTTWTWIIPTLGALLLCWFAYVQPNFRARVFVVHGLMAPALVWTWFLLGAEAGPARWIRAGLAMIVLQIVVRLVGTGWPRPVPETLLGGSPLIAPLVLAHAAGYFAIAFGVVALRGRPPTTAGSPQAAGRSLPDVIPICACCKKVRDGQDNWQQIERYIMERTRSRFTHGYCPTCFARLAQETTAARAHRKEP